MTTELDHLIWLSREDLAHHSSIEKLGYCHCNEIQSLKSRIESKLAQAEIDFPQILEFGMFLQFCKKHEITTKTHASLIDFWINEIVINNGKVHELSMVEELKREKELSQLREENEKLEGELKRARHRYEDDETELSQLRPIVQALNRGVDEMKKFMQTGEGKYKSTFQPYVDLRKIIEELESILASSEVKQ